MNNLFALVDCNNFYVSCERLFRPDLRNKPVAVLSNNDGCIVARSQEVKALGIKMAVPVYQVQHLIKRHHIHLFSSNYAFYADMSNRVIQSLEMFTPRLENYSIDESFLDLTGICHTSPIAYGLQIKKNVQQATGIPVCVGIAPSKTLAKLANYAAKKWPKTNGVVNFSDPELRNKVMQKIPVEEVWGVGRQTAKRLKIMGVKTAHDLSIQPVEFIQEQFNIVMARTVMELQGTSCLPLDAVIADKQQIVCSRSFKRRLTQYHELADALVSFCSRAAEKLRNQQSVTGSVTVFVRTNPNNPNEPQYQRSVHTLLTQATADTRHIVATAKHLLKEIFKPGYRYQKCGVLLGHIQSMTIPGQIDLFEPDINRSTQLMSVVDQINHRFPNGISVSTAKFNKNWKSTVDYFSKCYTTDWDDLAIVKCQ